MTLGEKIRKYRLLKGWTQKELGMKVGFSAATADSRIRKYESNLMAPKEDIRGRLVEVLDLHPSALSDINLQSAEDVMQVLFLLEEECGMSIERTEDKTSLIFSNHNPDTSLITSYLYAWYAQKQKLPVKSDTDSYKKSQDLYIKWKARFPRDLRNYWKAQEEEINKKYDPLVKQLEGSRTKITRVCELLALFRSMIQTGIFIKPSVRTDVISPYNDVGALEVTFRVSQMLQPKDSQIKERFAEFLHDIKVLHSYGMHVATELLTQEEGTTIAYALYFPPFMALRDSIEEIQGFEQAEDKNDYYFGMFEEDYKEQMQMFDFRIVEDIPIYSVKE